MATTLPPTPTPTPTLEPTELEEADDPPLVAGLLALEAVDQLRVKGRAPMTGYDRDLFGPAWQDTDRNGCDTRNDILRRDLRELELKDGTNGCVVLRGLLDDPFTGETIAFQRGQGTSVLVQVDHVVALADAWVKGAQQWDDAQRLQFANDPLNLIAVDGAENQAKGNGDTATWLPPHKPFRCRYVARQVAVKGKYDLWLTSAERDAMARVLSGCPTEPLPVDGESAWGGTAVMKAVERDEPPEAAPDDGDAYFANCREAWAAGKAPLRRGDAGYRSGLDGDDDGIACERPPKSG